MGHVRAVWGWGESGEEDRRGLGLWQNPTCCSLLGGDTIYPAVLTPFPWATQQQRQSLHERRGKQDLS